MKSLFPFNPPKQTFDTISGIKILPIKQPALL